VKDGAGVLTLGEQLSSAAVPSTVNSFERLIVRNGGVVAVSSPNSLPQSFNAQLVAVPADVITLDAGTLRIQSITNTCSTPPAAARSQLPPARPFSAASRSTLAAARSR
jgi:hypothetical protein